MLIVHSQEDSVVPLRHAQAIHDGAPSTEKKLLMVPQCEHIGSYFQNEKRYIKRIVDFLDECFEKDRDRVERNAIRLAELRKRDERRESVKRRADAVVARRPTAAAKD